MKTIDFPEFLVFLDRDGTIIEDQHYLSDPDGVTLLPGALDGLRRMQALGGRLVVVTNQSGIGRGLFDRSAAEAVNARMSELLDVEGIQLSGIHLCPHAPDDGCECRKPGTLLFENAAEDQGLPLEGSFMIGDQVSDIEAGIRIGAGTIRIAAVGNAEMSTDVSRPDLVASDLIEAADFIARSRHHGATQP